MNAKEKKKQVERHGALTRIQALMRSYESRSEAPKPNLDLPVWGQEPIKPKFLWSFERSTYLSPEEAEEIGDLGNDQDNA